MAPEIFRGEVATSASDIFSLGAFVYELFTGSHPFGGATPLDVLEAIECRTVASLDSIRPGFPAEVNEIVLRMLDRESGSRPTAMDVWKVLQQAKPAGGCASRFRGHFAE
jgi:serine/threonine-protein kinase